MNVRTRLALALVCLLAAGSALAMPRPAHAHNSFYNTCDTHSPVLATSGLVPFTYIAQDDSYVVVSMFGVLSKSNPSIDCVYVLSEVGGEYWFFASPNAAIFNSWYYRNNNAWSPVGSVSKTYNSPWADSLMETYGQWLGDYSPWGAACLLVNDNSLTSGTWFYDGYPHGNLWDVANHKVPNVATEACPKN